MYYVFYCIDHNNSADKRRSVREAHLKRLEQLNAEGRLLLAGPLLKQDHDLNMTHGAKGSLIVADFDSIEAANAWAAADPYATAEVYENVLITPFKPIFQ